MSHSVYCDRMALKQLIDSHHRNGELGMQQSQRHSVISCKMENDLVNHVKTLADQFYGLSLEKCNELMYEFALINNLTMLSNWTRDRKA